MANESTSTDLPFPQVTGNPSFPQLEEETLARWEEKEIFKRSVSGRKRAGGGAAAAKDFVFYDGPPFATGLPHYGHLLASFIKDTVPRYWTMRGYCVERRFGWDCHGLPVEMEMEKELGVETSADLEAYGVGKFNEACRSIVLRYVKEWRRTITRIGRWVDFDNDYKTMDVTFMETVWWVFKQLWDEGLVYEGHRVMPYSWRCATPLSNFEANQNYRDVQDPSVTVRMRVDTAQTAKTAKTGDTYFLAWTTTPWTLPANLALCVGPDIDYVLVRDTDSGDNYYLAEARLGAYYKNDGEYEILERLCGADLAGKTYEPLLSYFAAHKASGAFRVLLDDYVTTESGTGIVHQAPAFGEDDYRICQAAGIDLVDPVDKDGNFTQLVSDFAGLNVKEADRGIIRKLKEDGKLVHQATVQHSYPFCWRTDTPLIYKAISAWFINVEKVKERLVANNQQIHWVPDWVGDRRFGNWLDDARDWNISRNRYWGSCIPIWRCDNEECGETRCVGSRRELEDLSGVALDDLHKHFVDPVTWSCLKCGRGTLRRIPEVFDCWFESGAMPYGQVHYPFENKEWFEANFPADFIAEGLDQTRGWFYTLLVLSTALFDKPSFKNCVVNGLILAEDGGKMSKRLKNYTPPEELIERYGADAIRFYMLSSPVVEGQNLKFVDDSVRELVKTLLLPLWNSYRFFTEYANADCYRPQGLSATGALRPSNPLDRYILSELQLTVRRVTGAMDGYYLVRACRSAHEFLETLNNWFIRRSRRRFWRTENDTDKEQAFETLYHVLTVYCRLLAPFVPFLTDHIYKNLTGAESVHLADWPQEEAALLDEELSCDVTAVRRVVSLGHQLRARERVKTRQPLKTVKVSGLTARQAEENRAVILEELNVKELEVLADPAEVAQKIIRPNGKILGPRLRGAVQQVIREAKSGNFTELDGGRVQVGEYVLEPGEYETAFDVAEGYSCEADGPLLVLLDLQITETLRREGFVRDTVRVLQDLRRQAGYQVSDRVVVAVAGPEGIAQAIDEHEAYVKNELLAIDLVREVSGGAWDASKSVEIDGVKVDLAVRRAG